MAALLNKIKADVKDEKVFLAHVSFPLSAECAYTFPLDVDKENYLIEDLQKSYDKLFSVEIMEAIKDFSENDLQVSLDEDGIINGFMMSLNFSKMIEMQGADSVKDEWAVVFTFHIENGDYMLMCIQAVS